MRQLFIIFIFGAMLCVPHFTRAQTRNPLDELNVSYIYSAVMGTGTYKIDERRISMLRVPFAFTYREVEEDQAGIKLHAPVVLGYDALNYEDWLSRLFDDELMTLTILPGAEYLYPIDKNWLIKPFGNLGAAYDFTREETIFMGVLGIRGLGTWMYEDSSELRMGVSARYAMEYQSRLEEFNDFTMLEGGMDYRRDTHLNIFNHDTNAGIYYKFQLFLPDWQMGNTTPNGESDLHLIHEVGGSVGLQNPFKILGIPIARVRMGFKFGDGVRGWTLGTEFPF